MRRRFQKPVPVADAKTAEGYYFQIVICDSGIRAYANWHNKRSGNTHTRRTRWHKDWSVLLEQLKERTWDFPDWLDITIKIEQSGEYHDRHCPVCATAKRLEGIKGILKAKDRYCR